MSIYKTGAFFLALCAAFVVTACSSDSGTSSSASPGSSTSAAVVDTNVISVTAEQQQVDRPNKVTLHFKYDAACANKILYVTGGEYKSSCTIYTEYGYSTSYILRSYPSADSLNYSGYCYFYCE